MHVGTGTHKDPTGRIDDNSGAAAAKLNRRDHKDCEDLQIRVLLSREQHIACTSGAQQRRRHERWCQLHAWIVSTSALYVYACQSVAHNVRVWLRWHDNPLLR
jgi:hypothetical protein